MWISKKKRERARLIEKQKSKTKGQRAIENKAEAGARGIIV
jgi:hypothetical protein